ncbi:hypothetical protein [Carboxylicivirga linearis]|uniref:TonB C-terminal domain-containing protein n=1 Tax=Carboxylicivirga linearis TaxID=1628157 RepID=A0ABS5K093_9BACT|nr:hypothetical protein [Carboxylicivirga linearis]MBS2100563.1 hypothetical protein [Carboxylicivirga linearis]
MKKLVLTLVAALMLGSLFTEASARNTPEKEMKKCCQKIKKEVRRSLRGPSFEYLKPDCEEEVVAYLAIDEDNHVQVVKIKGNDERLLKYVKETIKKQNIEANPKLSGKMFVMNLKFIHQPA